MEIIKFDIVKARNEELSQFIEDIRGLADKELPGAAAETELYVTFCNLHDTLNSGLERIAKSGFTQDIADADAVRGSIYRGFVLLAEAYLHNARKEKARAARNIQIVIDAFGNIEKKSYNEETATITNFTGDMRNRCGEDLKLIGGEEWIEDLAAANETFKKLMGTRFDTQAEEEHVDIRAVRRELERTYRRLVKYLNALIEVNGENEYKLFVAKANERILYYKHTFAQREGTAAKGKGEEKPQDEA